MTTINVLSAPTFKNFLELIRDLRIKYKKAKHDFRVRIHLSYLRWPQCLSLTLLSEADKEKYANEWLTFMNENMLTATKEPSETFYLEEADQLQRLIDYMRSTKEANIVYEDFRKYITQCDFRRKVDFVDLFPELTYLMEDDYYG